MIGDPFLNYFALGLLLFVLVVMFYGIITIHDIPHAAGWISLFSLHALWPFLRLRKILLRMRSWQNYAFLEH